MGAKPGCGAKIVRVHSQPLPTRSCTPKALAPAGCAPQGADSQCRKSKFPKRDSGASSPHGYARCRSDLGTPYAARWNCSSVGSLRPSHFAYAVASAWLTYTGCSIFSRVSPNILRCIQIFPSRYQNAGCSMWFSSRHAQSAVVHNERLWYPPF